MAMTTRSQSQLNQTLYDRDFYFWLQTTAKLLKEHRFDEVDWENVIEEIESMGRGEKKEIKSRLIVVIEHLLKLMYWETEKLYNARGWRDIIVEQRTQIELTLEDSPSLRALLTELFIDCYEKARNSALRKYQLPDNFFSTEPPFSLEDVINPNFLPD
jgi:hypothetical protein